MTDPFDIEAMRRDRAAGTPGPWWTRGKYDGQEMGCAIIAARTDSGPTASRTEIPDDVLAAAKAGAARR